MGKSHRCEPMWGLLHGGMRVGHGVCVSMALLKRYSTILAACPDPGTFRHCVWGRGGVVKGGSEGKERETHVWKPGMDGVQGMETSPRNINRVHYPICNCTSLVCTGPCVGQLTLCGTRWSLHTHPACTTCNISPWEIPNLYLHFPCLYRSLCRPAHLVWNTMEPPHTPSMHNM
jgi:hypothetical protein